MAGSIRLLAPRMRCSRRRSGNREQPLRLILISAGTLIGHPPQVLYATVAWLENHACVSCGGNCHLLPSPCSKLQVLRGRDSRLDLHPD